MGKLLIVSLDAMTDADFERLAGLPHTAAFLKNAAWVTHVMSAFVTNTYPVHTSIVTGRSPQAHGIISNYTQYITGSHSGKSPPSAIKSPQSATKSPQSTVPHWAYDSRLIRVSTLWQAAKRRGLTTAAVM